jgi:perosamine synthetase
MQIPLSSPDITEQERRAVLEVLSTPHLSLGPKLPEFEHAVARRVGVRHAVAVNSGTSGLHLAVKAAGLGPDDEVITTPFSFVASANCVLYEGAVPRFVDIDPETYNIDVRQIERAITGRTRAILPVHIFGRPCPMHEILEIARRRNLVVIEDACEALGASYHGRAVGSFGQTGVFAFYPNKQITTGEGGVITTDDQRVTALCRSWRNQGRAEDDAWLEHERLGYNYRLSDLNCALGAAQLSRLDTILASRTAVANRYTEILMDRVPHVAPPAPAAPKSSISWFVYVVRLREDFSRQDRDAVLEDLRATGIGCRNYFSPIHLQPFYRQKFGFGPGDFPVAERISERTIALPFFGQLPDDDILTVCDALACAIRRQKRLYAWTAAN